eukprot:4928462-Amphidinium_carterae.1
MAKTPESRAPPVSLVANGSPAGAPWPCAGDLLSTHTRSWLRAPQRAGACALPMDSNSSIGAGLANWPAGAHTSVDRRAATLPAANCHMRQACHRCTASVGRGRGPG